MAEAVPLPVLIFPIAPILVIYNDAQLNGIKYIQYYV